MELIKATAQDLPFIYAQMEENFIREEIRDYPDALKVFRHKNYSVYHVAEAGNNVGFMCVWNLSGFNFLEHFVVYRQFRGKGYGGRAFDELIRRCPFLVLECELPKDETQQRRVAFYQRHGMTLNGNMYFQPPYRENGAGCRLNLMSSKPLVDFDETVKEIYREVYHTEYKK